MLSVKFTKKAVSDLSDIWNYTKEAWSEKQADKYYQPLIESCTNIAHKPLSGKDYAEIFPKIRGKKALKHIIFYRTLESKSIEITRILHERMDLKSKLGK